MTKKRTIGVFWRSYIILCAVLLILGVALTVFFYDFIKAFETGRPEYAVKEYVTGVTEADVLTAVTSALDGRLSGYENDGVIEFEVASSLAENELSYVRAFSETTDAVPVYDVYCGEKLLSLTLSVTDGGKYGFDNYAVTKVEVADEWLDARRTTVSVIVPSNAETTLNGKPIAKDKVVGSFAPDAVSEFEKDSFTLDMYEIADVFGLVDAKSTLDGEKLPLDNPSKGVYSSVYDAVDSVYTVIVPEGAEVKLNGITLTDSYRTGVAIPTDAHLFESETKMRATVYSVRGLRLVPTVAVTLDGVELSPVEDGKYESAELYDAAYTYPNSYKNAYTVTVPDGATLYCNGVVVGEEYKIGKSDKYPLPASAKKYATANGYGVKYTVTGLYAEPVFTVTNGDETCVGDKVDAEWFFYPTAGGKKTDLEAAAELYTRLYMKYTYEGWDYTEANYDALMEHVKSGSSAQKTLKASLSAMKYNSHFVIDKLEMKFYDTVKYSSDCYGIKVDFDSHGKLYKYEKVAVGTYTMIWVIEGGEWKLVEFVFS